MKGINNGTHGSIRISSQRGNGWQAAQIPLLQIVTSLLGQNSSAGGLAGIVQAFQKNRLGDIVNSWVGTGKNMPVTSE
jgi:uncharacterized protein YidB (DUF937 family)